MINVKIDKAINKKILKEYTKYTKATILKIEEENIVGAEYYQWRKQPIKHNRQEILEIFKEFKRLINLNVDTLVVIGNNEAFWAARAAIKMIGYKNIKNNKMKIIFIGNTISSIEIVRKTKFLKNRNFAINAISKTGDDLEFLTSFRIFRQLLETRVGKHNAKDYIIVTTSQIQSQLKDIALLKQYKMFNYPEEMISYYTTLTAVSLLPIYFAGININNILKGAQNAFENFKNDDVEENNAFKYAIARYYLSTNNYDTEIISSFDPELEMFNNYWKNLGYLTNSHNNKGIIIISNIYPRDIEHFSYFLTNNKDKKILATLLKVISPKDDFEIPDDRDNLEGLNDISYKTMHDLNEDSYKSCAYLIHNIAESKLIEIEIDDLDDYSFGELVYFLQASFVINAYLNDINPFVSSKNVNLYKETLQNIIKNSKK